VDTREVESKSNRDKIAEALEAKGVRVETRALRLGDMCWIARRLDGLGGEEDECVLDYVAERKRLDDLCISIKDGRYSEQCVSLCYSGRENLSLDCVADTRVQFRLSNSCIKHIYYIVEDWQVAERMTYDGLQIMTAKSQIQVHNRFFLKETHKLSETIDFLATMTDVIIERHLRSDLRVIPTRFLSRSSYAALQAHLGKTRPGERYLTSFQAYQELNDKNASKTLREKFARMLLCVKGMSAERVSAVLDVWETPRAMWDGLKRRLEEDESGDGDQEETLRNEESQGRSTPTGNAETAKKKAKKSKGKVRGPDLFFADVVQGEGRRKIGDALSKEVSRSRRVRRRRAYAQLVTILELTKW
jgi:crossover junction endonuclease MUS81